MSAPRTSKTFMGCYFFKTRYEAECWKQDYDIINYPHQMFSGTPKYKPEDAARWEKEQLKQEIVQIWREREREG